MIINFIRLPWNCPTCRAPQSVSPAELIRNYALEQLLEQIAQPTAPTVNQLHSDRSEIPEDINARLPP